MNSRNDARETVQLFADEEGIFDDEDERSVEDDGTVKVAREDVKLMNVVRAIVILFLLTVGTISGETVYVITLVGEESSFQESYSKTAQALIESFLAKLNNNLWVARSFATDLGLLVAQTDLVWPNVTYAGFDQRCSAARVLSDASSISFAPLLLESERDSWEAYATDNFVPGIPGKDTKGVTYFPTNRSVDQGIYQFNGTKASDQPSKDSLFPIWQMSPFRGDPNTGLIGTLFNEQSNLVRAQAIQGMMQAQGPCMTDFQYLDTKNNDFASYASPRGTVYYPIMDKLGGYAAGSLGFEYAWSAMLTGVVDAQELPVVVVVQNQCSGNFSFLVNGLNVSFMGPGDLHNSDINGYTVVSSSYSAFSAVFGEFRRYLVASKECNYRLNVYATSSYYAAFTNTNKPEVYRGIVLAVFVFVVGVFVLYDCMIERRQNRVVAVAQRSDAIVRSLFPTNVRDRLYEQAKDKEEKAKAERLAHANNGWKEGSAGMTNKHRINSFVVNSEGDPSDHASLAALKALGTEPIAEFYPETTILFADIAGFTAWSSEREPAQVFTLLETIYRYMDHAAKKIGVFKVETVGDCYVAATGIPQPVPNHAELMVRFARSCLLKVDMLTNELESSLGPGTSELSMRFGIHSGPVTAGVLRTNKARFQLFGDTMNTASRMESTGMKNKIQLSGDTADQLVNEGLGHWITKRPDLVHVKGKGDMQTYWLVVGASSASASSDASHLKSLIKIPGLSNGQNEAKEVKDESNQYRGTGLDGVLGVTEIDEPLQRLVDWNVDVLLTLLKRVVANRIASGQGTKYLSSSAEKKIIGHGLVLDNVKMVIDFPVFNAEVAARAAELDAQLVSEVKEELTNFVKSVASGYTRCPFHNFEHASHVILSANKLIKRVMTANDIAANEKEALTSEKVYEFSYGVGTDPVTHFALVFAALIHDVGHPAVPNARIAVEQPELVRKYTSKCLAEQHSVDIAWELLLLPRFKNLRACIYQNKVECEHFRDLVVNSVIATDLFDKELKALRDSRWEMAFHNEEKVEAAPSPEEKTEKRLTKEDFDRKATIVIEHIIQASDISHAMQHWYIFTKWNERLYREMYFSYLLGRSQKDPTEVWFEGELWFFDNFVIPLARKLQECALFGVSSHEYLTYALQNRVEWEKKGRDICAKFKAKAVEEGKELISSMDANTDNGNPHNTNPQGIAEAEKGEAKDTAEHITEGGKTKVIIVPPGKLGIVIESTDNGPVVYRVNQDSSLRGKLQQGDVILAIDGVPTKNMDNTFLSDLIISGQNQTRRFTISCNRLASTD